MGSYREADKVCSQYENLAALPAVVVTSLERIGEHLEAVQGEIVTIKGVSEEWQRSAQEALDYPEKYRRNTSDS